MENQKSEIVNLFITLFFILILFFTCYNCYVHLNCYKIADEMTENYEQEFLRFKIYGSSYQEDGNTVSGTVSIIDTNGNEIAVIERSWSGSYLEVEFCQCQFAGKTYFFPNRIYGKETITQPFIDARKGTSLEKYYDENGQCMFLGYGTSLKQRQNLYKLARFATGKLPVFSFGKKSIYRLDLSNCKTEVYYSIKRNNNGLLITSF